MSEHRTEVDGWHAVWRPYRQRIRILSVGDSYTATKFLATSTVDAPDLVEMRDRLPELSSLWDAIRHEYWTGLYQGGAASDGLAEPRRTRPA